MKKRIAIGAVVLIFFIVISFGAARLFSDHSRVADGRYQIQNNAAYPDAYILVEDGQAQFFHIDLNELYKDSIVEKYLYSREGKVRMMQASLHHPSAPARVKYPAPLGRTCYRETRSCPVALQRGI